MNEIEALAKSSGQEQTTSQKHLERASLEQAANFIRRVIREDRLCVWADRRASPRYSIDLPVTATVLDDQFRPVGKTLWAVTRDISAIGLCIYHNQPITAKYLELNLSSSSIDEQLRVLLEVVRCKETGSLFEIGGRFVEQV